MHLSKKDYKKASLCYAAVLQIMEGKGGSEAEELRRRCSLTLAECELQQGNLYEAIARCSEVIEEAPDIKRFVKNDASGSDNENTVVVDAVSETEDIVNRAEQNLEARNSGGGKELDKLRVALAKALYRRGLALNRLERPKLALIDLREANKILPTDTKILQHLDLIGRTIADLNDIDEELKGKEYSGGNSQSLGQEGTKEPVQEKRNNSGVMMESSDENLEEELLELVEQAQSNFPRVQLSDKKIKRLIDGTYGNQRSKSRFTGEIGNGMEGLGLGGFGGGGLGFGGARSSGGGGDLSSLLGSFGGLGGMGMGDAGGRGGLEGELGGLGALGGMMGSLGGGGSGVGIGSILAMLGPLLGDSSLITQITEIAKACMDAARNFQKAFMYLKKKRDVIVAIFTGFWVLQIVLGFSAFVPKF